MADDFDRASDLEEFYRSEALKNIDPTMPKGVEGDCDFCGEWSGRLVGDACAPCRDKYRLP